MKNLFDNAAYDEIMQRLARLHPGSDRQWGKMEIAQMMAHVGRTVELALMEKKLPRSLVGRLLSWMMKEKLYNDVAWKRNLPTAPNLKITDQLNFDKEKKHLTALLERFHEAGPTGINNFPHPFFGKLTPEQWGKSIYKHLDHHFQQFGV